MHINQLNEAMSCRMSEQDSLEAGMCATMFVGSDRYAMVVTEVLTPKKIRVAHMLDDHYKKLKDDDVRVQFLDLDDMKFYENVPDGSYHSGITYTLRKNGRWMPQGCSLWDTCSVHLGHADNYRDPCF